MYHAGLPSTWATLSAGHNGVVVPEEFRALQQCANMLGGRHGGPISWLTCLGSLGWDLAWGCGEGDPQATCPEECVCTLRSCH